MRTLLIATMMLALTGCESAAELATEKAIEAATGGNVDIDGKTVTVKDEEGNVVTTTVEDGEEGKVTAKVTDEDGNVTTAEFGSTEVPEGFPLPVIDGAKVGAASKADQGKKGTIFTVMLQVEKKSVSEIAEFYEQALKDVDVKARKREVKIGPKTMVQIAGKKGKKIRAQITVTGGGGGKEPTGVMINWTEK